LLQNSDVSPPLSGSSSKTIPGVGLTVSQVDLLNDKFGSSGTQLWDDIECLADMFWESDCDRIRGHHLLMTVGNFKRQGGTVIYTRDPLCVPGSRQAASRDMTCSIEGAGLIRDDPESWRAFSGKSGIQGLGVATTTTLLSALWPRHHLVIDERALHALIGLRGVRGAGWHLPVGDGSTSAPLRKVDWDDYEWYREQILEAARASEDLAPVRVERALYVLDRLVPSRKSRTWQEYGEGLAEQADQFAGH
jgi:hypothetical protein